MITSTQVTHVEALVAAEDIKILDLTSLGRHVLQLGPNVYVYLDGDGITRLLDRLLQQPEAVARPELMAPLAEVTKARLLLVDELHEVS